MSRRRRSVKRRGGRGKGKKKERVACLIQGLDRSGWIAVSGRKGEEKEGVEEKLVGNLGLSTRETQLWEEKRKRRGGKKEKGRLMLYVTLSGLVKLSNRVVLAFDVLVRDREGGRKRREKKGRIGLQRRLIRRRDRSKRLLEIQSL